MKFDDFTQVRVLPIVISFSDPMQHIASRKHRKFAVDEANFLQLDYILSRVRRHTVEEVRQEELEWERKCSDPHSSDEDEDVQSQDILTTDYEMFDGALVDLDS
jgi:regulatory subunit for Cdc7p protein kinase